MEERLTHMTRSLVDQYQQSASRLLSQYWSRPLECSLDHCSTMNSQTQEEWSKRRTSRYHLMCQRDWPQRREEHSRQLHRRSLSLRNLGEEMWRGRFRSKFQL